MLYFLAENLSARSEEFAARLTQLTGASAKAADAEVEASVERLFYYAGMADKFEGRVHQPPARAVTLALHEPVGVIGIVAADAAPLLGLISLIAPALAMGNTVVAVPSQKYRAGRDRPLPGHRDVRRAGRRDQHRHRKDR